MQNGAVQPSIIKLDGIRQATGNPTVSIRCPACQQNGTFDPIGQDLQSIKDGSILGQRKCPNTQCRAHIFVVLQGGTITSYPPEFINFDATGVPEAVRDTLQEAVACHASRCFRASAMMVRRTLEALCVDRGATGNDLKARIADLGSKIVLPQELLAGLDELRLLGNDAAHIQSRDYESIGADEIETAIEFAKEVLKAAYQYASLLGRLRNLRKQPG